MVLSNIFRVLQPQIIRKALDEIIGYIKSGGAESNKSDLGYSLMKFGFYIFLFALLMGLFMYMMRQTIIVMSRLIEYDLRKELFSHYIKQDSNFFKNNKTGELMSRIVEDINKVRMYLGPALLYGINLISLVVIVIITMFKVNPKLSLYTLLPLPLLSYIIYVVSNTINKRSEVIQAQLARITTKSQESFSGIRIVKSYATELFWKEDFRNETNIYKNQYLGLSRIDAMFFPSMLLLIGLSTLITLYVGGLNVYNGSVSAGNIAEFVIYVNMLTWPVSAIGWCASIIQQAEASQKRINDFLYREPQLKTGNLKLSDVSSLTVAFNEVSFKYPEAGKPSISNLNLKIYPGEKIGIVGKTGSGKSTIAELLVRMYDPQNGTITINNIPLNKLSLYEVRSNIAYVPQDVFLFSESIAENILFGREGISDDNLRNVTQLAAIDKEIETIPGKYNAVLGERGVNLSGGQKQRISVARALMKEAPILILDDCLSAVDAETEQHILSGLEKEFSNKTVLFITQRLKQTQFMDRIIVLEEGKVVQEGTFVDLVARDGLFKYLYQIESRSNS